MATGLEHLQQATLMLEAVSECPRLAATISLYKPMPWEELSQGQGSAGGSRGL